MKVRIQNDGQSAYMTMVSDADTGEIVDHVTRLSVTFDANDKGPIVRAILVVEQPVVDIIVDAEIRKVCPCCERPIEERLADGKDNLRTEA